LLYSDQNTFIILLQPVQRKNKDEVTIVVVAVTIAVWRDGLWLVVQETTDAPAAPLVTPPHSYA
jgi:predicted metal-binding membrane protein